MRTTIGKACAIGIVLLVSAIAGTRMAGAICDWTTAGCSRRGGAPDADEYDAYCTRGSGDCYECEYTCRDGGFEKCAEGARTYCVAFDPANTMSRMGYTY